jgi:hypothetical protein
LAGQGAANGVRCDPFIHRVGVETIQTRKVQERHCVLAKSYGATAMLDRRAGEVGRLGP